MKPVAAKLAQEIVADHFGTLPEVRLPPLSFVWHARQTQGDTTGCVRALPLTVSLLRVHSPGYCPGPPL